MTPLNLLEAHGLSCRYGPHRAVTDLSLSLKKGEILGLLGANGAGKSTTMKMLAGVLAPSDGHVTVNGISLAENPKAAKQQLGYLPEQPPLYPELTVVEYLRFCSELREIPRKTRTDAVNRAMVECDLQSLSKRLIGNLSKGYQQRCGIAQAILHQPAIVILDEPTVGLDPIQIRGIRRLIRTLGSERGIVLSSHILAEVQTVCHRVVIMRQGRLVYDEPLSVADSKSFDTILVGFARTPNLDELAAIRGIDGITVLDARRLRIAVVSGEDPRAAIADTAVARGWGLTELHAEFRTLEDVFVRLTARDDDALTDQTTGTAA